MCLAKRPAACLRACEHSLDNSVFVNLFIFLWLRYNQNTNLLYFWSLAATRSGTLERVHENKTLPGSWRKRVTNWPSKLKRRHRVAWYHIVIPADLFSCPAAQQQELTLGFFGVFFKIWFYYLSRDWSSVFFQTSSVKRIPQRYMRHFHSSQNHSLRFLEEHCDQ